ncbi:MAG: hypothetical protein KGL53_00545 [Elusimicrobia bacterium]|nr:hypothetical protein [Elusimicrobiota bacterium]
MDHLLPLDLEKIGQPREYRLYYDGKGGYRGAERGHLHLTAVRRSKSGARDDFDLEVFPYAETAVLELPKRNVLIVKQTGLGVPAGDQFNLFSSANGRLYRVQFLDGPRSEPIIFGEHYSAGSPAKISFLDGGRVIKTINAWPLGDKIHFKRYEWDGANFRLTTSFDCKLGKCPDVTKD